MADDHAPAAVPAMTALADELERLRDAVTDGEYDASKLVALQMKAALNVDTIITALRALSDRDAELARVREALIKWHVASVCVGMEQASNEASDESVGEAEEELAIAEAALHGIAAPLFDVALTPQPAPSAGETYAGRTAREFKEGQQ